MITSINATSTAINEVTRSRSSSPTQLTEFDGADIRFNTSELWSALDTLDDDLESSVSLHELAAGTAKMAGTTELTAVR